MRKAHFVVIACVCSLLSGCLTVNTMGPNGPESIIPLRQSIWVDVYNKCAPMLRASGRHHVIDIPIGGHGQLQLWAVPGENNQEQDVVFEALSISHKGLGTAKQTFSPDYNSAITRKTWIIGAYADQSIQDNQGGNVCQQYGLLDEFKSWAVGLAEDLGF